MPQAGSEEYPGAFTDVPAGTPNTALAGRIREMARSLGKYDIVYMSPEGEIIPIPDGVTAASAPIGFELFTPAHHEGQAAPADETLRPKKIARYTHPLAIEAQGYFKRSNDKHLQQAAAAKQTPEEVARDLHSFANDVMPFVSNLAELLAMEIEKQHFPIEDNESMARFLKKIVRARAPTPEEFELPAGFDPHAKPATPPSDEMADHIATFTRAEAGYVIAADMLTTQLGAELSGRPLDGATTADLRNLSALFSRAATHDDDEPVPPNPAELRGVRPLARQPRRPLEPDAVAETARGEDGAFLS